jgi:hypothetical protein
MASTCLDLLSEGWTPGRDAAERIWEKTYEELPQRFAVRYSIWSDACTASAFRARWPGDPTRFVESDVISLRNCALWGQSCFLRGSIGTEVLNLLMLHHGWLWLIRDEHLRNFFQEQDAGDLIDWLAVMLVAGDIQGEVADDPISCAIEAFDTFQTALFGPLNDPNLLPAARRP